MGDPAPLQRPRRARPRVLPAPAVPVEGAARGSCLPPRGAPPLRRQPGRNFLPMPSSSGARNERAVLARRARQSAEDVCVLFLADSFPSKSDEPTGLRKGHRNLFIECLKWTMKIIYAYWRWQLLKG